MQLYTQNPLHKILIFTIYQNYTLALMQAVLLSATPPSMYLHTFANHSLFNPKLKEINHCFIEFEFEPTTAKPTAKTADKA